MTAFATDALSLVLEGLAYPWKGGRAKDNLLWAAESGSLEVAWSIGDEEWSDDGILITAEAVDAAMTPCWDGCNGISTVHRAGWCLTNPEHADLDCGCGEWHDEPDDLEDEGWTVQMIRTRDAIEWGDTEEGHDPF